MKGFGVRSAVVLATMLAVGATQAASWHHHSVPARARAAAPGAQAAGLGEIMALQQMCHSKLWFAGSAGNWPLADYELDELKEGFDDVRRLIPVHDGVPLAPLLEVIDTAAIPDLAKTIAARDAASFAGAFDELTAACNGCHQAARHVFIVIQRPASVPYSNQSFAPAAH